MECLKSGDVGISKDVQMSFDSQLDKFRRMKECLAEVLQRSEKTQEEFDRYIKSLREHELCKYMTGISNIVSLCNFPSFHCKYRGKDSYGVSTNGKYECQRERIIKLSKLL